jgi:hypothetical protein
VIVDVVVDVVVDGDGDVNGLPEKAVTRRRRRQGQRQRSRSDWGAELFAEKSGLKATAADTDVPAASL